MEWLLFRTELGGDMKRSLGLSEAGGMSCLLGELPRLFCSPSAGPRSSVWWYSTGSTSRSGYEHEISQTSTGWSGGQAVGFWWNEAWAKCGALRIPQSPATINSQCPSAES